MGCGPLDVTESHIVWCSKVETVEDAVQRCLQRVRNLELNEVTDAELVDYKKRKLIVDSYASQTCFLFLLGAPPPAPPPRLDRRVTRRPTSPPCAAFASPHFSGYSTSYHFATLPAPFRKQTVYRIRKGPQFTQNICKQETEITADMLQSYVPPSLIGHPSLDIFS